MTKAKSGAIAVMTKAQERRNYIVCSVMTASASLLGFVNPVLSSFLTANIIKNFNFARVIATALSMILVKGTRMLLRARASSRLKGSVRAPYVFLKQHIGKKLWWIEPIIDNWGWIGMKLTKITGGVSVSAAAFAASFITDTVNALLSGIVYYFTQSYVLSLLTALVIPVLAVGPWFAKKTLRYSRAARYHGR